MWAKADWAKDNHQQADAAIVDLRAAGWALVPEEPTEEQERAHAIMNLELESADRPEDDGIPIDNMDFRRCPRCTAQPGDPGLCPSCIHNREVIYRLQQATGAGRPTVADVLEARRTMHKRIADAIEAFEDVSGLVVDTVHASHLTHSPGGGAPRTEQLLTVTSDVRLPR
jgi:hypothetical protein